MTRRIRYRWTCSDHVRHAHHFKFMAWLCGRAQRVWHWWRDG